MATTGIVTNKGRPPRAAALSIEGETLVLRFADGEDRVPVSLLMRRAEASGTPRFNRADKRGWELSVANHAFLAELGRLPLGHEREKVARFAGRFAFLGSIKSVVLLGAAGLMLLNLVPARAALRVVPEPLFASAGEQIQVPAEMRCTRSGGEASFRKIIARLDPGAPADLRLEVVQSGGVGTAPMPGGGLFMTRNTTTEIEIDALAALVAHNLAHLHHRDADAALVDEMGLGGLMMAAGRVKDIRLPSEYDEATERQADREALAMMERAGIPLADAAALYAKLEEAAARETGFGYEERMVHRPFPGQAAGWAAAARAQVKSRPVLDEEEARALTNFCWRGETDPATILHIEVPSAPPPPVPPNMRSDKHP